MSDLGISHAYAPGSEPSLLRMVVRLVESAFNTHPEVMATILIAVSLVFAGRVLRWIKEDLILGGVRPAPPPRRIRRRRRPRPHYDLPWRRSDRS